MLAWVAGPWAATEIVGTWMAAIPTLAVLVALPGIFSTVGDKRHVVVAVSGRVRFSIELLLVGIAVYSAFLIWEVAGGTIVAIIAAAMLITGIPRNRWLLSNRVPDWPLSSKLTQHE